MADESELEFKVKSSEIQELESVYNNLVDRNEELVRQNLEYAEKIKKMENTMGNSINDLQMSLIEEGLAVQMLNKEIKACNEVKEKVTEKFAECTSQNMMYEAILQILNTKIAELEGSEKEARSNAQTISEELEKCNHQKYKMEEDHRQKVEKLNSNIAIITEKSETCEETNTHLREEIDKLRNELEVCKKKNGNVDDKKARYEMLGKIQSLEKQLQERVTTTAKCLPNNTEINKLQERIDELISKNSLLQEEKEKPEVKIEVCIQDTQTLKEQNDKLKKNIKKLTKNLNISESTKEQLQNQLDILTDSTQQDKSDMEKQIKNLNNQIQIYKTAEEKYKESKTNYITRLNNEQRINHDLRLYYCRLMTIYVGTDLPTIDEGMTLADLVKKNDYFQIYYDSMRVPGLQTLVHIDMSQEMRIVENIKDSLTVFKKYHGTTYKYTIFVSLLCICFFACLYYYVDEISNVIPTFALEKDNFWTYIFSKQDAVIKPNFIKVSEPENQLALPTYDDPNSTSSTESQNQLALLTYNDPKLTSLTVFQNQLASLMRDRRTIISIPLIMVMNNICAVWRWFELTTKQNPRMRRTWEHPGYEKALAILKYGEESINFEKNYYEITRALEQEADAVKQEPYRVYNETNPGIVNNETKNNETTRENSEFDERINYYKQFTIFINNLKGKISGIFSPSSTNTTDTETAAFTEFSAPVYNNRNHPSMDKILMMYFAHVLKSQPGQMRRTL